MNVKPQGKKPQAGKAEHGAQSEVTWDGGKGRQPYANQEEAGVAGSSHGGEFAVGDRGELSGRNFEQLEQVRKKP
jgi:hypothetical protein